MSSAVNANARLANQPARWGRGLGGRFVRDCLGGSWYLRTPLRWAFDRLDEYRARRLRASFGRRFWLLSWRSDGDGGWRARLSSPSLVCTLERTGKTRTEAIHRAVRGLTGLLKFRDELKTSRLRDAQHAGLDHDLDRDRDPNTVDGPWP